MPEKNHQNTWLIRRTWILLSALVLSIILPILSMAISFTRSDFNVRHSANIAPPAAQTQEAILQVYGADAYGWRGIFAVHTWFLIKPANAQVYTTYQVFGWNQGRGRSVLAVKEDVPDRFCFGSTPKLLADLRGKLAQELIPKVEQAVQSYPFPAPYTL